MQPLDAIFSSPRSAVAREQEESGSEDMEISSSELGRTICAARIAWLPREATMGKPPRFFAADTLFLRIP
ncbi:hypothetical protein M440DRAFT_1398105 [Trichoderma longibrachiatum ATCC 18648]|uniref:Uncharacterized protein n=1 Tax=Trichoderma longibrachiatum ATCC 18648 TaxID=983965 RepID=A0A2T4CGR3_TRILO|nr:hypothetical protein M440DRAFT_1398105 [Trichoderma longibrachiatum ATCC 18648]